MECPSSSLEWVHRVDVPNLDDVIDLRENENKDSDTEHDECRCSTNEHQHSVLGLHHSPDFHPASSSNHPWTTDRSSTSSLTKNSMTNKDHPMNSFREEDEETYEKHWTLTFDVTWLFTIVTNEQIRSIRRLRSPKQFQ